MMSEVLVAALSHKQPEGDMQIHTHTHTLQMKLGVLYAVICSLIDAFMQIIQEQTMFLVALNVAALVPDSGNTGLALLFQNTLTCTILTLHN